MSTSMTDRLFAVGEALAELDLVVRQLDDGSLTVTTDDDIPDERRVVVSLVEGDVLKASLAAAPAPELTAELCRALDALNLHARLERYVWRDGLVHCELAFPLGQGGSTLNRLHLLFGAPSEGVREHGEQLQRIAAGEAPWRSILPHVEALPPSYLAGSGQKSQRDSVTDRYGALETVPGRAEATPEDLRRSSGRHAAIGRPSAGSGGGRSGGLLAVLVGVVLLAGGAAVYFVGLERSDAEARPDQAGTASDASPRPTQSRPSRPDRDQDPLPDEATGAEEEEDAVALPRTEEAVLAAVREAPADAAPLVERWIALELDRADGARRRMLEALGEAPHEAGVGRLLLRSFREHPVSTAEAMSCLESSRAGIRRLLIDQLAAVAPEEREDVRAFLDGRLESDGEELLIHEALLRLGGGDPGVVGRLLAARGPAWATVGDGRAILEQRVARDAAWAKPLFEDDDAEVRILALDLLKGLEEPSEQSLRLFVQALDDPEPSVRQRAIEGCVAVGDARASWSLARALVREESPQVRDMARSALGRLPRDATIDLLARLYGKSEPSERLAALRGFEAVSHPDAVSHVAAALEDSDRQVRLAALLMLNGMHGHSKLRATVVEHLGAIRRLAIDRSDKELYRIARKLHYAITGGFPQER